MFGFIDDLPSRIWSVFPAAMVCLTLQCTTVSKPPFTRRLKPSFSNASGVLEAAEIVALAFNLNLLTQQLLYSFHEFHSFRSEDTILAVLLQCLCRNINFLTVSCCYPKFLVPVISTDWVVVFVIFIKRLRSRDSKRYVLPVTPYSVHFVDGSADLLTLTQGILDLMPQDFRFAVNNACISCVVIEHYTV